MVKNDKKYFHISAWALHEPLICTHYEKSMFLIIFKQFLSHLTMPSYAQACVCWAKYITLGQTFWVARRKSSPKTWQTENYTLTILCSFYLFFILIIFLFLRVSSAFDNLDWCLTDWGRLPRLSEILCSLFNIKHSSTIEISSIFFIFDIIILDLVQTCSKTWWVRGHHQYLLHAKKYASIEAIYIFCHLQNFGGAFWGNLKEC